MKVEHVDDAIKPEDFTGESWSEHRHVREVPTDAYGNISFGGPGQKTAKVTECFCLNKNTSRVDHVFPPTLTFPISPPLPPQYVRVSTDSNPKVLYQLLTEQWGLSPPNMLISVTGGAKNFYLKARLKSMFHRGLIKVAQTTGQIQTSTAVLCVKC